MPIHDSTEGGETSSHSSTPAESAGRKKILLGEGSSVWTRELLFCLGPNHTIDICDPSPLCQNRMSRFVRRYYKCPSYSTSPKEYLEFIIDRLRNEQYDVLLPTHEQVYLFSRFRDQLGELVGLAVPRFEDLKRVFSKAPFARLLDELNLPTPPTRIVRTREAFLEQEDFPCFVKINFGTAGKGVRHAANHDELSKIADEYVAAGWLDGKSEIVIQKQASGIPSVFFAVFQEGSLVGWYGMEITRTGSGGWAMCGRSAIHRPVVEDIARMGKHLNWNGALFVDYFYDSERELPQYIECNPRIGGTYQAKLSGTDLAENFLRVSLGESVQPLPECRVGEKFHQGMLMLMSRALENANRRELLAEWWSGWRGRGIYQNSVDTLMQPRQDWWSCLPNLYVTSRLLLRPASVHKLVAKTVANYSLPESAARDIEAMPEDSIAKLLHQ